MSMHQLAVVHEHPRSSLPLFAALEQSGIDYVAVHTDGHMFDPIGGQPPAPVVFNRVAMRAQPRDVGRHQPVHYAMALLDHWQGQGALVLNGTDAMGVDASCARQLALIHRLGLAAPASRIVHDTAALAAAAQVLGYPMVVKPDVAGSDAAPLLLADRDDLAAAIAAGALPSSNNGVWLCQAGVRPRGGSSVRIEVLGGRYLYALAMLVGRDAYSLAGSGRSQRSVPRRWMRAEPPPSLIAAAEMLAREAGMDSCGIDYVIDDACGTPRFQGIDAQSSFVEDAIDVLGWDPHDRLIEWLWHHITRMGG